jgi:glutathione synthase
MKIAVVMNPISNIDFKKDSTLLLIYEAQKRNHDVFYIESNNLFFDGEDACALSSKIEVKMDPKSWFSLDVENRIFLKDLDVIFMRQDPPFDMGYINNTYVLDSAENDGVRIYNKPSSLRNFNEKISILEYLKFCTETIVTSDKNLILNFIEKYKDVVAKPLNLMGGQGIEKINFNQNDLIDKLKKVTKDFKEKIMVQKFIERVYEGDKRILVINGRPSEYAVVRTPAMGEFKGNLAAGGIASIEKLNKIELNIASEIAPKLKERGILIAGLDIVGDFLTEINITCPTCFRELLDQKGINLMEEVFDFVES